MTRISTPRALRAALFLTAAPLAMASLPAHAEPMHVAKRAPVTRALPQARQLPPSSLRRSYGGTKIDVTTYHYDNNRTGWNPTETDLTPAAVQSSNFGLLQTLAVDGNVLAQPLLVSNLTLPDGSVHDVLIIATGHDSVYAYDAQSYALLWQVSLGTPQSSNDVGCYDVQPEYGISSTPVIVRSGNTATLYVVAATENTPNVFKTQLRALNVATGADVAPAVTVNPSAKQVGGARIGFDPQNQWNRASLAYNAATGSLFMGIGSHCDNNAYGITGWLLHYEITNPAAAPVLKHAFNTVATNNGYELSSIWMTGYAPAIDPSGNVYVVTGNGDFTPGAHNWGESALRLNAGGALVTGSFTPAGYANLNNGDTDFGSGGIMLLPKVTGQLAPPLAVAIGKAGSLYLLNQNKLGGLTANDTGPLDIFSTGGVWGGPAFYNGPNGPTVLVQGDSSPLLSLGVSVNKKHPHFTQLAAGTSYAGYGGSLPIVSSNGAAAGTGVVWLITRGSNYGLEAYDASALGNPIFSAAGGTWSNAGNGNPFLTAMQANGRVYVTGYLQVQVFGLN